MGGSQGRSGGPVYPNQPNVPWVKRHPSLGSMRCLKVGSGGRVCRGCLGGAWDLLSEARVEMATGGAETEAVDQSQAMPELGVRRGPEGKSAGGSGVEQQGGGLGRGQSPSLASLSAVPLSTPNDQGGHTGPA